MNQYSKIGLYAVMLAGLAVGLLLTVRSAARGWTLHGWSDASRQWVVCQYVREGINPYEVAQRLLRDTFGPATGPDRVRLGTTRIYSISSAQWTPKTPGILPGHPPPEATYPLSSLSMLLPTIGFLPEHLLLPVYTSANLVFLVLLIWQFGNWLMANTGWTRLQAWGMGAMVCLLWPPLQYVIQNGQAGILSVLCAWLAVHRIDHKPVWAGYLFLLAMIKPSMAVLFFIIPLVKWRWTPIGIAFVSGLVLTVLPSFWLGEWPWVMLAQWLDLCRYVLQGAFTVQEILNALGWENTVLGSAVVMTIWGGVLMWCVIHRRASTASLFALLALANLAWTYHERHDFVLLAFLPVWFIRQAIDPRRRISAWAGLLLCLVLGMALSDTFYVPALPWAHAIRWAGRLSLLGLWWVVAMDVRDSHAHACVPPAA